MKKQPRLMTAAACMLIVLFATTGGVQIGAAVVCVGDDGHIDVESFFDGCCSPAAPDDHGPDVNVVVDASPCGDCVDVQLRMVTLKTREGSLSSLALIAGFRSIVSSGSGAGGRKTLFQDVNNLSSQSLTLLSTVVLRT